MINDQKIENSNNKDAIYTNENKIGIYSLTFEMLVKYLENIGEKKFRAEQIFKWLYKERVKSFSDMTNIKNELQEKLNSAFYIENLEILNKQISKDGTIKYLLGLPTGGTIESVLMKYKYGNTICISTQKGCKMGCKFCASTKAKFEGNLTAGEIISQIIKVEEDTGEKITNVVFMGIGEPLDNFKNTKIAISNINDYKGLEIGARRISISTCGVVDKILELANLELQCTLSVSLHATNDKTRSEMMPINNRYNIAELMKACKRYNEITGRRISFEYALIKDKNDSLEEAQELANLIKKYDIHAHVNLIPINEIEETKFKKTSNKNILAFRDKLNENGIVATIRRELGSDIKAACGQLRRKNIK